MDALATYEQRFAGVVRRFDLHPDHLAVHGRGFGSSFDLRYDLSSLSGQCDQARMRAPLFYGGLVLIGVALLGIIVLAFDRNLVMPALVIVSVIALVGVAALIYRARPLRAFMFKNKAANYVFEIIGAGPDACQVDQFVSSVIEQIRKTSKEV